ncbi:MAG: hypothetical protein H7Y07_12490 [Pyrinomonadaceae bacterium]|nr:hypothetical protein [Sphingobacteriaceae bacterium]
MDTSFKKIFKASGAAAFGQGLNIVTQLLLVPIFIKFWGAQLYGEWLILSAAPSVIAMAGDLGFGVVTANEMNINVAKGDKNEALKVFQNSWIVVSVFSLIFLLMAGGAILLLSVNSSFNISFIAENHSKLILLVFILNILVIQQNGLLLAALRSEGNYVLGLNIGNISKLIELSSIVLCILWFKAQPLNIAVIILLVSILTSITYKVMLSKRSSWVHYGTETFDLSTIKRQTPIALSFLSFSVTQAFSIQGTVILVGYILGPAAVVVLSTLRTFMNVIKQVVSIINASIVPELTTAYGLNDFDKLKKIFTRAIQALVLLIIMFNVFILILGKPLYLMWTKYHINVSDSFFYTFALITSISALWNLFGIIQGATNKAKKYAMYNIISIVISISGILIFTRFMGLEGILVSMLLSEVFMLFFVTKDSLSILEVKSFPIFCGQLIRVRH